MFNFSNLPYWLFLGLGISLFLFVIFSGGGDDDINSDLDADADADFDADSDGDFSPMQALGWLGIGKAPLILLLAVDLSLWGLIGWMLNASFGIWLGGGAGLVGVGILLSSLVLSLLAGSVIARPLGQIFAAFGEDASGDRLVGCIGTVCTSLIPHQSDRKIGQVDVVDPAKNLVTVNAVLPDWAETIPKLGQKVLVIDRSLSTYLVVAQDSPDQDFWFETTK